MRSRQPSQQYRQAVQGTAPLVAVRVGYHDHFVDFTLSDGFTGRFEHAGHLFLAHYQNGGHGVAARRFDYLRDAFGLGRHEGPHAFGLGQHFGFFWLPPGLRLSR